jgi:hypothetical protein
VNIECPAFTFRAIGLCRQDRHIEDGSLMREEPSFNRAKEAIAEGRACVEQALPILRRYA